MRERERLIDRIRQIRRAAKPDDAGRPAPADPEREHVRSLESRVEHLEALLLGLQDSVHRESTRLTKRVSELEARVEPGALGKALSEDARTRGL